MRVCDPKLSLKIALRVSMAGALAVAVAMASQTASAAIVSGDILELAVAPPPDDSVYLQENGFKIFAADQYTYDDNIYRLPSYITDIRALTDMGPNATRQDYINTVSAGGDGQWDIGRQIITLDVDVDDNRYATNTNLDNVSTNDKLIWNWNVGGVLSGQVGGTYSRGLISFINATAYGRNVYESSNYFAAGRYQLGPHWAIFGGVLDTSSTLTDSRTSANDYHGKTVAMGGEYAVEEKDTIGFEYRYTDARYPPSVLINDDYREDAARALVNWALTEKTTISASFGFLKRDYEALAIESFSGDVWRASLGWKPTDKLKFSLEGWRNLQAYVTSQSDYYISTGVRLSPEYVLTEKVTLDLGVGVEDQHYIGLGLDDLSQAGRRDTLTTYGAGVKYLPLDFLTVDFEYAYEHRSSDESIYQFNDNLLSLRVMAKW